MKLTTEFQPIRDWATEKGIAEGGDLKTQTVKLMEEAGELAKAVLTNNTPEIIDAIGDCVVVLTNLAMLANRDLAGDELFPVISIEECINSAYNVIAKRTGKMVDGSFVKDTETASKTIEHYGKEAIDGEEHVNSLKCCNSENYVGGSCTNCGNILY